MFFFRLISAFNFSTLFGKKCETIYCGDTLQSDTGLLDSVNDCTYRQCCFVSSGMMSRLLLSFSFYTNGCKLLSTAQGSDTLGAINGIRFLSMSWVILGHSYTSIINYAGKYLCVQTLFKQGHF